MTKLVRDIAFNRFLFMWRHRAQSRIFLRGAVVVEIERANARIKTLEVPLYVYSLAQFISSGVR